MAKPNPQGGLVIRYDYLWASERLEGREEGSKNRPCAVVLALSHSHGETERVVICGITHSEPTPPDEGVEIPAKVKRHLGLDVERSWAILSEGNLVDWDDPGIIPVAPDQWAYGFIPPAMAEDMARRMLGRYKTGQLPLANRAQTEQRRAGRDDE